MTKKIHLFIIILFPLFLQAQNKLPNNIFLHKLPNGLDVLVVEDNSVPLATITMTFKAGGFTESEKFAGLTGIYQDMLLKGNKDYSNEQDLHYHAGGLGILNMNYQTSEEYSKNYFTLPKSNLEAGLNFMNSMIRFAKFNPGEFAQEKETNDNQLKQKESYPAFALTVAMVHHLWGNLYNRKLGIGNHESIKSATIALMDSVKNKYYYPNNAILIIGGDVAHEAVFKSVEKIYGDWKASSFDPFKKWPIPEFAPLAKTDYFIVESPLATVPLIRVDWQGPDTRNDISSTYCADVFSYIVNQKSSKLKNALIQSGLAQATNLGYLTLKYVGPITLTVNPYPSKVKECVEELKKQIALMGDDDYITDEQIETAKRMLEIRKIRQEEITSDYVHSLSFWWASASLNYFAGYNENLKKVTRAGLKNYINKYINNKPYCAGLLINPELNEQINATSFFTPNN